MIESKENSTIGWIKSFRACDYTICSTHNAKLIRIPHIFSDRKLSLDLGAQAQTGEAREPPLPGIGQIQDSVEPGPPNPVNVETEIEDNNAKDDETVETGETGKSSAVVARTTACLLATLFSL